MAQLMAQYIGMRCKIIRLSNMKQPYAFRLAAICAADTNQGKWW